MKILVTGGAGYIGSHTCVELLNQGHEVVVLDNLVNASAKALDRVRNITGKDLAFFQTDLLDEAGTQAVFTAHEDIEAVIHFAGLKAVGESVAQPLRYYHNNITGTLNLIAAMEKIRGHSHCIFVIGHGLRQPGKSAHHRKFPLVRDQPLRPDKADD